jgi:aminoglycoside 2'-N-acetyltransferase I
MTDQALSVEIKPEEALSRLERDEIIGLCSRAYEEDYSRYLESFTEPIHVLGKLGGTLVSHALWITRWLQIRGFPAMKTAYVEAVATEAVHRGKGFATCVMQLLADEIQSYDIGALSPAGTTLYARLGWEYWQGFLYVRKQDEWILVPDEAAMILRTPNTPGLDIYAPLSIEWRDGEIW